MKKLSNLLLILLILFAVGNTSIFLGTLLKFNHSPNTSNVTSTTTSGTTAHTSASSSNSIYFYYSRESLWIASASWILVAGLFVWRQRVNTSWRRNGLSRDVFELIVNMKGSRSRIKLLKELQVPKDRLQLAKNLSLDWSTIDYHMTVLLKHDLVSEKTAYGNVKLYELTSVGQNLLKALEEMSEKEKEIPEIKK